MGCKNRQIWLYRRPILFTLFKISENVAEAENFINLSQYITVLVIRISYIRITSSVNSEENQGSISSIHCHKAHIVWHKRCSSISSTELGPTIHVQRTSHYIKLLSSTLYDGKFSIKRSSIYDVKQILIIFDTPPPIVTLFSNKALVLQSQNP